MVIAPKNHFKQYPFVDRESYIQTFIEAINSIGQKEFSVLVYYGVAGIGKTSLRKELSKYLEEYNCGYQNQEVIWASIDLHLDKHREKNTFLVTLKTELQRKSKIKFPAFEIAHAIYWKKANPEIPLRKENYLFFEGDEAFDDFFGVVDKIPYFSIVPAAARLLKNAPDYLRKWWKKNGETELQQLSEKEPLEIEVMLPYFWAQDLNNYLERVSKPAVLFIDTYEALWERERGRGNFNARDEWVRELISNLSGSSLWVICGREELRWNEIDRDWEKYLEQYELEKLPEEDALDFLNHCGIKEEEIQRVILKGSEGVPYYLELAVDTYTEIVKIGSPVPDNFARTRSEIFDRFMIYLSFPEQETLKVLSTPRFWNKDIFNALIEKFKTSYPLTAFSELNRFSFVQETEGKLLLHPLMRESLQVYQDQELKEEVHNFMCTYYSDQLKSIDIRRITQGHELALAEAFYHAKESLKAEDLLKWFTLISDRFMKAAFWQLIAGMYEEILQDIEKVSGSEKPDLAIALSNLASLYRHMGAYDEALKQYRRAFDIAKKVLGPEHPDTIVIQNNLAELYDNMGFYNEAREHYQTVLIITEKVIGPEHLDFAALLNNFAELYRHMGIYDKALEYHQRALKIRKKSCGPEHPDVAATLNNLAALYEKTGAYDEALNLSNEALKIREKFYGQNHPDVATTLNNLAELYRHMGNYDKALEYHQRALKIRKKSCGLEHPDTANSLNNIATLYEKTEAYTDALEFYQRALNINEKILGPEHPDIAATLNNLAALYEKTRAYSKALQNYEKALQIVEKILGPEHPDTIIIQNNLILLLLSDWE